MRMRFRCPEPGSSSDRFDSFPKRRDGQPPVRLSAIEARLKAPSEHASQLDPFDEPLVAVSVDRNDPNVRLESGPL